MINAVLRSWGYLKNKIVYSYFGIIKQDGQAYLAMPGLQSLLYLVN